MFTDLPRFAPGKHAWDFMTKHEWRHHFVLVSVEANGLLVRAIDDKGEVFDEFSTAAAAPRSAPLPQKAPPLKPPPESRPAAPATEGLALSEIKPVLT